MVLEFGLFDDNLVARNLPLVTMAIDGRLEAEVTNRPIEMCGQSLEIAKKAEKNF